MSNYTKTTNFASKDNLSPGNPLKIVKGTEIDTEFNNIQTAVATKTDNSAAAITGGSITGITDLAVADGGTGASTATAALNNLLPSQTSNANKYLQTDGTNATWDAVSLSTADITGTLPVANGGTGVTSSTGTGDVVLSNSPTLVTPALGTPASGVATNLTGLPISTGVSGLGTGVATFLGTPSSANLASAVTDETGSGALVFANSPTLVTPTLGTPASATLTNATGLPISTGVSGLGTGVASFLATPSSANLATAVSDETGSGALVFANSPTLVTPILGTPTSATLTNATGLPISTGVSGLGTGVATFLATPSSANLAAALTDETGSGANVFATSPTLVTPILGTPTSATLTNATGLPLTTGVTGTLPTANGGTNLTSFTSGGVVYASSTSALATGSALSFTGTNLGLGTTSPDVFSRGDARILGIASTANAAVAVNAASGSTSFLQLGSNGVRDFQIQATSSAVTLGTGASGNNPLIFAIGFNEFMRLNTTGLGIGTTSPSSKLHVNSATETILTLQSTATSTGTTRLRLYSATATTPYDWYLQGDSASGTLRFYNAQSSSEAGRFDASNRLLVGLTSATSGGGVLQISNGITFPATQSASSNANTLDDYEEGTFTPVLEGTTTAGTGTYTNQTGWYTKIGDRVFIQFTLRWTAHTGTGHMKVAGLPFTSNNSAANPSIYTCYFDNIALTASHYPTALQDQGTTTISLRQAPTGGGSNANIPMDTSGNIEGMSGNYRVA